MTYLFTKRNSRSVFVKCRGFGISLNLDKCAFMVCSKVILRFIVFKKRKTPYVKKMKIIVKISLPTTLQKLKCSTKWSNFTNVSS
jgi:hypothetical protein